MSTSASPKSKLLSIIEENIEIMESKISLIDRKYWAESAGYDYIQTLALDDDVEAIRLAVNGSYYAICCIAAVRGLILIQMLLNKVILGLEIHRASLSGQFSISLAQDEVRAIRGLYDD